MFSLAQPLFCSRTLWRPLHVFSQRCPDNPRRHGSENNLAVTDGGWGPGQCHPFPLQRLSRLAWPQEGIHIRDSHPHGPGQSPGSSRSWRSPHNGNFFVKRTPYLVFDVNSVLLTESGSQHRPVLRLHPEHLSVLHSHPQESRVDDAQRKGPQGHWPFLLHLLDAQSLNVRHCSSENHCSTEHTQLY